MLSASEKRKYVGGTDDGGGYGPNGYYLFNTMSYLKGHFTGSTPSYQSFFDDFTTQYGTDGVTYDPSGAVSSVQSGVGSDFQNYFDSQFNTSSSTINNAQGMIDALNRENVMVAAVDTNAGIDSSGSTEPKEYHNVVIKGIDEVNKVFEYFDPTTGKNNTAKITDFTNVKEVYGLNPITNPDDDLTTVDPNDSTTDNNGYPTTTYHPNSTTTYH